MKKVLIGVLALFLMASCSNDNIVNNNSGEPEAICMSAGVTDVSTKAGPINSGFTTNIPIGVYAYNPSWQAGTSANVINNDPSTVLGSAGHSVTFTNGPYYYPPDGTVVYVFGYAPYATETTAAAAATAPKVTHSITGQEDVMWASGTGQKVGGGTPTAPVLNFSHKLTQLQFTFKSGTGYPAAGYNVISLLVKAQPNMLQMNIGTGALTASGSTDFQAITGSGAPITTAGANANSPVMTMPASGASAYLIDIVVRPSTGAADVSYLGVPVNVTAVVGSAHMITVTFNDTGLTATATVADWVNGTGGSATAQ